MIRIFQILVLSVTALLLTGCDGARSAGAPLGGIKLGDLAPSGAGERPAVQFLETANIDVFIFWVPAANISVMDDVWGLLSTGPLRFNNYDAFGANLFSVGFGQKQLWDKVGERLRLADARNVRKVSFLLSSGQPDDLNLVRLRDEKTIFYVPANDSMTGRSLGPGSISLRLKAEKISGLRGVCDFEACGVFAPPPGSLIPELEARRKADEFLFTSTGFKLKMSPDDFVFLGPTEYVADGRTLGSLFFSKPAPEPIVRMFLLICTSINY